jgi:hypothetical protein
MKTTQINLRIEKNKLNKLKQLARLLSVKRKENVLYTDLVRDGIDVVLKKHSDLLED